MGDSRYTVSIVLLDQEVNIAHPMPVYENVGKRGRGSTPAGYTRAPVAVFTGTEDTKRAIGPFIKMANRQGAIVAILTTPSEVTAGDCANSFWKHPLWLRSAK